MTRTCRSNPARSRLSVRLTTPRVCAETPDPQRVADEPDPRRPAYVVLGLEVTAQRDTHAQDPQKVVLEEVAPQALWLSLGELARPGADEGDHRRH
jgi:hypothetical protein